MLDCESCQIKLEKQRAGAATPEEIEAVLVHLAECERCREHAAFLDVSSTRVDLKIDPKKLSRIRKHLGWRVRLSILAPLLWLAGLLSGAIYAVTRAVQLGELFPWSVAAVVLGYYFVGSLLEIREKLRSMRRFLEADNFLERCEEEMNINVGLNLVLGVMHFTLAIVTTAIALFLWKTPWMQGVALFFWSMLLCNLFRVFIMPKPWNGGVDELR
jgi:hypothetical protein